MRIDAGVAVEFEPTGNSITFMVMGAAGLLMLGNWRVTLWLPGGYGIWPLAKAARSRPRRSAIRSPEESPTFLQQMFYGSMVLACLRLRSLSPGRPQVI